LNRINNFWALLLIALALLAIVTLSREDFFLTSKPHEITDEDNAVIAEGWLKITNPNLALFQLSFYTKEEEKFSILYETSKEFLGPATMVLVASKNSRVLKQILKILKQEGILAERGETDNQPYNVYQVINLPQGVFQEQLGRFLKGVARHFYHLEIRNCLFIPDLKKSGISFCNRLCYNRNIWNNI